MTERRQSPERDRQHKSESQSKNIDQPAADQQAHRIGGLEELRHEPIVMLGPMERLLQFGRQIREDAPVDVVCGGYPEEKGAYHPAVIAFLGAGGGGILHRGNSS